MICDDCTRTVVVEESELEAVPWVDGDICPLCGEDTLPNDEGNSFCPRCAEEYKAMVH